MIEPIKVTAQLDAGKPKAQVPVHPAGMAKRSASANTMANRRQDADLQDQTSTSYSELMPVKATAPE